jgi:hypothetical protein
MSKSGALIRRAHRPKRAMSGISVLPEHDLAEPERGDQVFSQALEIDRFRAGLVLQRDCRFDGRQSLPELKAPSVDVEWHGEVLERHLLRLARHDSARLTHLGQSRLKGVGDPVLSA